MRLVARPCLAVVLPRSGPRVGPVAALTRRAVVSPALASTPAHFPLESQARRVRDPCPASLWRPGVEKGGTPSPCMFSLTRPGKYEIRCRWTNASPNLARRTSPCLYVEATTSKPQRSVSKCQSTIRPISGVADVSAVFSLGINPGCGGCATGHRHARPHGTSKPCGW